MAAQVSVASEPSGSRSLQPTTSAHDLITFVQNSLAANAGSGVSKSGYRDTAINHYRWGESSGDGEGGRMPPTEPRLMRRNITPPPQQKSTAHRPTDRRTQHDLYRPSSYRPADDTNRGRRISVSDTWRPGPFHYMDAANHGSELKPPSSRTSEYMSGARVRHSQRNSSPSSTTKIGLDNVGYGKEEINRAMPVVDDSRGHNSQKGSRDLSNDGELQVESATTSSLAFPPLAANLNLDVNDFTLGLEQRLSSTDAAPSPYLRSIKDMTSPLDKNSVAGASKLSRFSNEETASNSSTTNSRNRSLCRECHTPGSFLTPLVSCTSCGRGYHHSCGNPKPPKSARTNEFVCGKCLKRKGIVRTNGEQPRSATLNAGSITSPASTKIASMPKPLEVQPPSHPNSNNQDHHVSQTQSSQGELYKSITCPFWKQGRCNLYDDHCLFAHVDTGREAPSGRNRAKAFTCPTWKAGHCSKSSDQCLYSHQDTGLYVGFNHNVLRKHITCYYWKIAGSCRHYEEDCPYAHRDTGILAWQPGKDARSAPSKNSLKSYICPRWEMNEPCRWYPSDCPYSHRTTAKSCLPSTTDTTSQMNARPIESSPELDAQLLPDIASPSTSVPPKTPVPSLGDSKEPENIHNEDQTTKIHSVTGALSPNSAIASDILGHTSICDDTPAIGHHSLAGRHMAKRGGRAARTLTSNHSRKPPLQHQPEHGTLNAIGDFPARSSMADVQISTDKEQGENHDSSRSGDNTGVKGTAENGVKKCEKCERRILGSANRCVACAATDDRQYEDGARASGSLSKEIDVARTESTIPGAATAQKNFEKGLGFDDPSRRLVANVRKRTAQDDNLFVPRKKSKMSALPVNPQTRSLAESYNNMVVPLTTQANAQKLLAQAQPSAATSTGLSSLQTEPPLREEGDPLVESIMPTMESEEPSAQRQSPQAHDGYDTSSDSHRNQQAHGLDQTTDHGTGVSSSRSENLTKDVMSQSGVTDTPKRPSRTIRPPTMRSVTTRIMEKENARRLEKARELGGLGQLPAEFVGSDNQQHRARTRRERLVDDSDVQDDRTTSTPKDRVTLSAKIAERRSSLSISDRDEPIYAPVKASLPTSTLKSRCKACIAAHRKCLHRLGGARGELDPLKCMTFLQENPERPLNGKFSESYWLKIKEVARFGRQASNGLSALKSRGDATRAAVALSVTESSDESMVDEADCSAAEPATRSAQVTKSGLTSAFHFDQPRLRSQARAAAITDANPRQTEEESDDDLPLAITRLRNQSKNLAGPLNLTTTPTTSALRNSKEEIGGRMNTISNRVNGLQHPCPQLSKTPLVWSNEEEERALEKLRERGVEIEIDSDSDESFSDDDDPRQAPPLIIDPLRRVLESRNPFDVDSSLDLRNPENRYQALGITPPWNRNRPTKKQLMGNLLLYQCRDNKLKYGNPHYRVMRKSSDVPVTAIIEKDDSFNTPDVLSGHEPENRHVPMTFREFIGMPKQPIIAQGKSKDELVFVERLGDRDRSSSGMSRTRRYRDDETFPFVYT